MVSLSFDKPNKIITVLAPDTEITMQELVNLVRDWEDELDNMEMYKVLDASGKQDLGGGVLVGITVTLLDWKLKFQDRAGPSYTLCNVTGGNLVRYDTVAETYGNPIEPASYVTVTLTASSSATLQELSSIQHSSFNDGVTVEISSPYSGTDFPVGTPLQPVNNISDAMSIAAERGFYNLYIKDDITLTTGDNVSGMNIHGQDQVHTTVTVETGANVTDTIFQNCRLTGTLDGGNIITNSRLADIIYFDGFICNCLFEPGTIQLGNGADANILNCWTAVDSNPPIIDFGGSGQKLSLSGHNGHIKLINKTGTEKATIDMNAGEVTIDSTVTAGTIYIRGVAGLNDNSMGATIISENVVNPSNITDAVWDEPTSDHTTAGSTGKALSDAGGAGNPWSVTVSGNTSPGTFGELVYKIKKVVDFIKSLIV